MNRLSIIAAESGVPRLPALLVAVALAASVASWAHGLDGFNVSSSTFAHQYNGNQIWDGSAFQNGWSQAGYAAGSDPLPALSLSGSALRVTNSLITTPAGAGNNGWLQQDTGSTPWELGTGNWTIELSGKVNEASSLNDNFVLWMAVGGSRLIVRIAQDAVGYGETGADLISGVNNADAFHTYRIAYEANNLTAGPTGTYHVWRDNVPISGVGVSRQASDANTRLIVGDCCSSLGNPVDPFEIQYVRYDMSGAFSPIADQGVLTLEINRNTSAMTFRNTTGAPLSNIIGYTITSGSGGLNPAAWDKQSTGSNLSNDNDQWTTLAGTSNEVAEAVLSSTGDDNGGDVPATTGAWNFGNAWRKSPFEDVAMELLLDDGSILSNAGSDFVISYTGNGGAPFATGDLDFDGDVDPADWAVFKSKFHGSNLAAVGAPASHRAELYNLGDLNADGLYSLADFAVFEAAYDAVNGIGALAAIPEPTTATLLVICGTTYIMTRRKHARTRTGRLWALAAMGVVAGIGGGSIASAQTNTITNPGTAAAGDKATTSAFAFRGDGGTFPASVSPPGSLTDLFVLQKITLKRPDDATTPSFGAGTRQTTAATTPVFLDVYTSLNGATDLFSGYVGSSSSSVAWSETTQNATYSFDFANLLLTKSSKYWFVFSEDNVEGEVSNFRHRVTTGGSNTGTGDNAAGYLLNDTAQIHTQGGAEQDWGNEFVAEFAPVTSLKLVVNTTSGAVSIVNPGSALNFSINSYSITSASSLKTNGWSSLEEQGVGGDPTPGNKNNGDSWEEFDNVGQAFIGEGFLAGSTTVTTAGPLSLGSIFTPGAVQDLAFTFTATNNGLPAGAVLNGTVEYVAGGFSADFDGDGEVDGVDLATWKSDFAATAGSDADGDGDSDGNDFLAWQRQLGSGTAVAATAAVPEPPAVLLALGSAAMLAWRRLRRLGVGAAAAVAVCFTHAGPVDRASADVFNDRHYTLGDLADIGYDSQGVHLAAFPGAINSGAYQDLVNNGGVTTVNVGVGGLNRPGLATAANGAAFDGLDDALTTNVSLNSPNHMYNTAAFFPTALIPPDAADDGLYDAPSTSGVSSDGDASYTPAFPHNYQTVFGRGIQLWARPTGLGAATPHRQDLVMDSNQHGIFITAGDTWGLQYDGPNGAGNPTARQNGSIDSGVSVAATLDANGWVHVMELTGADDPVGGHSAFGGALLVNGVAIVASNTFYDPDASGLSIGGNRTHDDNFYAGAIDEVRVFLWGENADRDPGDANTVRGYLGGAHWGTLNLSEDNDWIKQKLASLGVTSTGDVDLNGVINAADATAFVSHWRKTFLVDGLQIGDWNSRQQGDLDYSGDVDLGDAYIVHAALDAVGLALNFELLSAPVPEPSAGALLACGLIAWQMARRRLADN